jgi:polyphosphate:AMP phosphotransferase
MFESAELGHVLAKTTYERRLPRLRKALLDAQFDLLQSAPVSVVILVHGMDGAGKGATINILNAWMDARHIHTVGINEPSDEEKRRAHMWRFWRLLPPKGKTALLSGSWYSDPLSSGMLRKSGSARLDRLLDRILRFERMLAQENVLVLKFWLHLSKGQQRARFEELERRKNTRWRVTRRDWRNHARYDKFHRLAERVLRATDAAHAPWVVVDGSDARHRDFTVARTVLEALSARLVQPAAPVAAPAIVLDPRRDTGLLDRLDLTRRLPEPEYEQALERWQNRLARLSREAKFRDIAVVAAFEGVDAAGKGGTIRRITAALDARMYRVVPTAAPTDEERAHPYLWRFWRHAPQLGQFVIFDRSWYGRVLVERVEGFASDAEWTRAYGEVNDFEEELADGGAVVAKYWLQISHREQLARFEARQKTGYKKYKITPDDWRNRAKWDDYQRAACDMFDRTSTECAPWVLVEAENKYYARIKVLKDLCRRIEAKLK